MRLEDLSVGAIIMCADRKRNPYNAGETWLVKHIDNVKAMFYAICLHSRIAERIGETETIPLVDLPDYDLITVLNVQSICDDQLFQSEHKKDLYLRWAFGRNTSLGKIGEKTPYKLENGRNLVVGDVVKISREGVEYGGCLVAHDRVDGYFIMGIALDCNDRTGEIAGWNVSLESAFCNRLKGDTFNLELAFPQIEVVDCPPEEK